jgi:hypothetical protein
VAHLFTGDLPTEVWEPWERHIWCSTCWCRPELIFVDPVTGNQQWIHFTPSVIKQRNMEN